MCRYYLNISLGETIPTLKTMKERVSKLTYPTLVALGIITCKKQQHVHDRNPPDSGKTVQPYSFITLNPWFI